MAVTESSNTTAFPATSALKEDVLPLKATTESSSSSSTLEMARSSYSEIDRLLDLSTRSALSTRSIEDSGHSESEAYYEDPTPVPSADFVDLTSLSSIEEAEAVLQRFKEQGEKRKSQNAKDLMMIRSKLVGLEGKLERKLGMASIAPYTQAMKMSMPLPTIVITNHTQLCRAFHVHEVYTNQIKKMQKRNKRLIAFLNKQKKPLREESERRAAPLREQVDTKRQEIVQMCRILEINPDDWKKPSEENELISRISDVLTNGIPTMINDWMTSMSSPNTSSERKTAGD